MPSLADHIDRLTLTARSIRNSASATASTATSAGGPFTQAVLTTPLGDLIRDIDPSELGLFTLVPPAPPNAGTRDAEPAGAAAEIARIDVVSATPLRKHPAARRDDILRPREPEPEVYAEAALKYLDRYATIRPMPRARSQVTAILEQLHDLRANIQSLNASFEQAKHAAPPGDRPQSPKTLANEEEQHIKELHVRLEQLKKRKESLQGKRPAVRTADPSRPAAPKTPVSPPILSKTDSQEDEFWNTPGARRAPYTHVSAVRTSMLGETVEEPEEPANDAPDEAIVDEDDAIDEEGEKTVVLKKLSPPPPPSPPPPAEPEESYVSEVDMEPPTPVRPPPQDEVQPSTPADPKKPKLRITADVQRITAKIWSTVGDIIMPGHPFDVSGTSVNKPPRAKETIAHLHTLSAQTPALPSPTASSLSSVVAAPASKQPSTQQILTAHMLLALLAASPGFALPLAKLKETLGEKAKSAGGGPGLLTSQVTTRVLYGSVAKRLIKIERGGGEQVVRFDV
ncbi:hypothetical protein EVG20_g4860 [Dentipellis fragilis]|uniref:DASH complex subunit Spc34 n=1 Tax=Dentipellis fragilis TaxID=205917 RepID=A0A4Y9YV56_9AGAM|nr:hypothetical protein EVG20_g4860 [Dentipellis fragilis]